MVIFTYNDYLDCMSNYKMRKIVDKEKRKKHNKKESGKKQITDENNKIEEYIKGIMDKEDKIANFINHFFKIKNWYISKDTIEKYDYMDFLEDSENIVYKLKEKEVYFFIKIQKEVNYNIPYIILTECINFVDDWKIKNLVRNQFPIIIPIIISIGEKKWNIKSNSVIRYTSFQENRTNLAYNVVKLSEYSKANKQKSNTNSGTNKNSETVEK